MILAVLTKNNKPRDSSPLTFPPATSLYLFFFCLFVFLIHSSPSLNRPVPKHFESGLLKQLRSLLLPTNRAQED